MFQTLRARLTGVSVAIATLSLIVLSLVAFLVVRANLLQALDERIGGVTQLYAADLAQWVKDNQRVTGSLKAAVDLPDPVPALLAAKQAGGFDDAYFVHADKRNVFSHPMPEGYDGTARPWYKQAEQEGKATLTPAYVDASTGKLTISFVEPVQSGGRTVAVVGSDVHLDTVANKVNSIHPTGKSFAFLLDGQSNILAHANPSLLLKPAKELDPALDAGLLAGLSGTTGHAVVRLGGKDHLLYAAKVAGTPWVLAVAAERADALSALDRLGQVALTSTVLCVIAAALVMAAVVRRMLGRLVAVRDALQDIASGEGDLTRHMDAHGHDELAQIGQSFNAFTGKIASVLQRIRDASESVRLASSEIASGNNDLSARTEQQASSLEETASAMEQLTATVQQNAANARQANELAASASQVAGQGGSVMQQVVQTMGGIDAASRKIVDIIQVIDGIAFQTNILALNAAVEAARAGEQGRGFAVVAGEVRTLAQRAASAAKEIKGLIDDSVTQVDAGSRLVKDAGATMEQVEQSIRRVTSIVNEISNASQEQSTGISEVGSAVSQMDQATQQNAALVEQASAAAHALQQQAHDLAEVVAGFKLPPAGAHRLLN
ncbi:MAG: chemotaxis protein [Comamonadaceae bacterium SCN 68-20]|nr:MAG: chemotaxis protein [Comamonadaceae bacterium SCN 68-20]OJX29453.1 MAG: chemotaxis protein [Burkholderiales bacterium 68-20]